MNAVVGFRNADQQRGVDVSGTGVGPYIYGADNEPERATYGTGVFGIAPGATPTDFLTIFNNSASKIARIKSCIVSGIATAAANIQVQSLRRTTVDSGGTFVALTPTPHDSSDTASAMTVGYYTAAPTGLGTLAGVLHPARLNLAPAANGSIDRTTQWQYTWQNDKAMIIRPGFIWALNLAGQAWPTGGLLDVDIMWTEE
jgi:hypothetical protein